MTAQSDARFATEEYLRHIMLNYMQMTEFVKEPSSWPRPRGSASGTSAERSTWTGWRECTS